jgi:7-cyano-7-deazaguanine reductase
VPAAGVRFYSAENMAKSTQPKSVPSPGRSTKESLTLLGRSETQLPASVSHSTLETFENRYPQRDYIIEFDADDFTSLCPITGQPDFATLHIEYVADRLCIETKSLKFYLASFRNCAAFNEEVANRILDDLVKACSPRLMRVFGQFASRGGIRVSVRAEYEKPARGRSKKR